MTRSKQTLKRGGGRSRSRGRSRGRGRSQRGGSRASDMVMQNVNITPQNAEYDFLPAMKSEDSLKQYVGYKLTGGNRSVKTAINKHKSIMRKKVKKTPAKHKSKSSTRKSSKKHSRSSKSKKHHVGGGSDWRESQYSMGSINNPQSVLTGNFTESDVPSQSELMNPPNLGAAGSGM